MIIKKLELHGFKSFPEKTKLVFHPGITAIIGPNGTGKSNIVDALLWVLRGRRISALRGDRSGDIIFNGSEKKAPLSMADVNLFLGRDDHEMKISHRVFRSGESEYRMDGKRVRLKDIQDALWKNSIGETNYFVIEQGSIGAFLSSKPIEKRALLEEAAGTSFYKEKKRQAENKLENTEQNLIRLEDIISEVNKGKNSLQRQARDARKYRILREKIRELTLLLFSKKLHHYQEQHKEVNQNYQNYLNIERELISRLKTDEKDLAEIRKKAWMLEKEMDEEKEKIYSLKSQYSNLYSDQERETKRIQDFEEKKERSEQESRELQQELKALDQNKAEHEKLLHSYQGELREKQERLEKAEKSNQEFQKNLNDKEKHIENLREQYLEKISSHTEIKNNTAKLEKEIELAMKQEDKIDSEVNSELRSLSEIKKQNEKAKQQITRTQKTADENEKKLTELQNSLTKKSQSINEVEKQIAELKQEKSENSHYLKSLEKLKQKEKDSQSIPELQKSLPLLADVVESDEKSALLIDVFYKKEAKSFLLKPEDLLKCLSKGRLKGHFLLLHPQEKSPSSEAKINKEPQVLGLLKSKIKTKPDLKKSLSYLPDAVIVKDLKEAAGLWIKYPENNFITLQGDLLFSSGMIVAGEKKEGLFALTREIKSVSQKIDKISQQIDPLELKLTELKNQKENLEKNIDQIRSIILKEKQNQEVLKKDISFDEEQKKRIQSKIELLKHEKQKIIQENAEMTKQKNNLDSKVKKIEEEVQSLKNTIKLEEKNYQSLQNRKEQENKDYFDIKREIEVLQEKKNHLVHRNRETEERTNAIKKKLGNLEKEIKEADREKEARKKRISEIKKNLMNLEQVKKEKEAALRENEEKLYEVQKLLRSKEDQIQEVKKEFEQAKENRIKWEIKKAEKERDLVNCEEACWQELKKTAQEVKKEAPLPEKVKEDIEQSLNEAKEKLEKIGSVNLMAEEEYNTQKKRYDFLTSQRQDLMESIQSTRKAIKKIDTESKTQFLKALIEVNKNFQDVFSLLFKGGNAQIKLSDEDNPLESGLDIRAQPPGKKVKNLSLLSGGEKALTSLAFFFALFRYKPAPFCILDEVDAALDETNLERFLNLMKEIKNQTQFIIVTHNFKTMEVADYIYGTAMSEPNITDMYSVRLKGKEVVKDL